MLGSYFISKIRYIIKPDGRIVWKIIAFDAAPKWWYPGVLQIQVDLWTSQIHVKPSLTELPF